MNLDAIAQFRAKCIVASNIMGDAAKIPGLPMHYRVQAESASRLAGISLHAIDLHPDRSDATAVIADLQTLWGRIVDPLIEAIGDHANEAFGNVDTDQFKNQLCNALEGNATFAIEEAWNRLNEGREEAAERTELQDHSTLNKVQQGL